MLLKIRGFVARHPLFLDFCTSLVRCRGLPQTVKCVHVEGHIVQLAIKVGDRGVHEVIKFAELFHVFPNGFVARSKDVRTVRVDIDTVNFLGIAVSTNVATPL